MLYIAKSLQIEIFSLENIGKLKYFLGYLNFVKFLDFLFVKAFYAFMLIIKLLSHI